jgi:ABC-type histidine transport system ATPase subunit
MSLPALDPELTGEVLAGDAEIGARRHDHDRGESRDGLCARGGESNHLHGNGDIVEEGPPQQLFTQPEQNARGVSCAA